MSAKPEIVVKIRLPTEQLLTLVEYTLAKSTDVAVIADAPPNWTIGHLDKQGHVTSRFRVSITFEKDGGILIFTPDDAKQYTKLATGVAAFLGDLYRNGFSLETDLRRYIRWDRPSEAAGERIATYLGKHGPRTIQQISHDLAMPQCAVVINLQTLATRGIVGNSPADADPRKFYLK